MYVTIREVNSVLEKGQGRVFEESLEFSREGGFLLCDLNEDWVVWGKEESLKQRKHMHENPE